VFARVSPAERIEVATWLTPGELALFDAMPPADRRHGLGAHDPDLLVAGLLHDCGKGPAVRLPHRVAWSLGEHYGTWIHAAAAAVPGFGVGMERIRAHADRSADLMLAAGVSERAAELARHQAAPVDPVLGELLRVADEAA
jgi:hypothetical protein